NADGTVRNRRRELGHKQIPVGCALVSDDLWPRRGGGVVHGGQSKNHGGNQGARHQPGMFSTRTGHRSDLPHSLLHLATMTHKSTIRGDSLGVTAAGGATPAALPRRGGCSGFPPVPQGLLLSHTQRR